MNEDVRLRIWFDNSSIGFQQLVPDQRISSVGYAMLAAQAVDVSDGTITNDKIAPGTITADRLAPTVLSISSLDSPEGTIRGALNVTEDGFVGIGTDEPTAGLHVAGARSAPLVHPTLASQIADGDMDDQGGTFDNLDGARDVHVSGKFAYVASINADSLTIIDVSDPTKPRLASQITDCDVDDQGGIFDELDGARDVYVSGKYAYVVSSLDRSFTIIDISDPTKPRLVISNLRWRFR